MRYRDLMTEARSSVATRTFAKLYHVGTLDITHKGEGSYEGAGLSVSLHPDEWQEIARLQGSVWRCDRPGNRFVDFHRLSKPHRAMIGDWAVQTGWATRKTVWRVEFYDGETDEKRYFTFHDAAEAKAEADEYDTVPVEVPGELVSTPALAQRMRQRGAETGLDLLVVAYAEDVMKIDGVWWNDNLDVATLSAPRGVIVPSMIAKWSFTVV